MTTVPPNPEEPTEAVPTGAFDATIAQPAVAAAPPDGPGSPGGAGGDGNGKSKRGLIIALVVLGVLVVLLAIGLVVALATGNDKETATTTTSTTVAASTTTAPVSTSTTGSSASTTKGTSATTTTAPSTKPAFTSLSLPSTYDCPGSEFFTVSWATKNATQVTISIDGPGIYASYPATGSAQIPFACAEPQHTYIMRAIGPDGTVEKTQVITRV